MSSRSSSKAAAARQLQAISAFARGGGRAALEGGAFGGAFFPPRVVEVGDGVAQLLADGAGVAADELADGHGVDADGAGDARRAVAHYVQDAQPQPGPARVQPGRGRAGLVTVRTAAAVPGCARLRPEARL